MKKTVYTLISLLLLFHLTAAEVSSPKFKANMEKGFLTQWVNLETGETFDVPIPELKDAVADAPYIPGGWWVDWKKPAEPGKAEVVNNFVLNDENSTAISLKGNFPGGEIHALQWGLHVPYDNIRAINWPRGLAPARLSGNGFPESMINNDYLFGKRLAMLAGASHIRHQYYVIEGKKGGLLVYFDNPELKHHLAMEFKRPDAKHLIISNRSIMPPPWQSQYESGRWIIRQYSGPLKNAAKLYQDYIVKAYDLKPLEERPTRWAKDISFVYVNAFARGPLPAPGYRQPQQDYLGDKWAESLEYHKKWLDQLAQTVEPSKTMFYITDWRQDGMDMMFPNANIDPYYSHIIGYAKKKGFKMMLHCHNHLMHRQTTFWKRYLENAYRVKNKIKKDVAIKPGDVDGVAYCALRNIPFVQLNKLSGSSWDERKGLDRHMDWVTMNPAHEGFRYLMVGNLLSAVRASNADAIHLDVPNIWVDLRGELYGMNQMQGQREFYKLLRETLDANGFEHVAIATEVTPFEGFMKYVDFAQNSRDTSAKRRAEALERGSSLAGEELLALQDAEEWEKLLKERALEDKKAAEEAAKKREFRPDAAKKLLAKATDLGEPSIDNMVIAPYIQSYPHLGAYPGGKPLSKALSIWYSLVHDVMPHNGGVYDFDKELSPLDQGLVALGRFMAAESPRIMNVSDWEAGDIARYKLKDGRIYRVFRLNETTLRLEFTDGKTLAELDLLEGWKNDAILKNYEYKK